MKANRETAVSTYYPWFDWLRLALALIVMFGHDGLIDGWSRSGNFAVQVFFALSGWLIGGLLLNLPKAELPRFYFNRAIRIWIPYFVAFGLLLAASLLRDPITAKWFEFVFYKASFVYNLFGPQQMALHRQDMPLAGTGNHFWSVNAEEQFYLLAPFLLVLTLPKYGRSALVWTIIALAAWLTNTYASIVFGVLAATIVSKYGSIHLERPFRVALAIIVISSAGAFFMDWNYYLIVPICSIAIVLLLAVKGLRRPWGVFAGGISYPLYLNHWIGVFVANALFKNFGMKDTFPRHLISSLFDLALAAALYWWVDRHMLSKREQMFTKSRGRVAIGVAYGMVILGLCVGLFLQGVHN
jgi:peptidoglycan/LPS O-acetylase OafA/YrhL